jgi:hypothetical protein
LESIISLVTTILLLALALLAKKYRLLLREVLRETKKGLFAVYTSVYTILVYALFCCHLLWSNLTFVLW